VVVTSHYADKSKDWPIEMRPYLPEDWVQKHNALFGKEVYIFKSKLQLGLELIDDIKSRNIQFSHLLIDSWYGNSPDFIKGVEDTGVSHFLNFKIIDRCIMQIPEIWFKDSSIL